jgi:CarD family transcriptional regulator
MSFDVGDEVVYPHHGAAIVVRRESKEAFGETAEYLVLKPVIGELSLNVRADRTEAVGLREVVSPDEVEDVFDLLRRGVAREPTNWSRRFKNHEEKLKSGDVYEVAEVVRNLWVRDQVKGVSAGEKKLLGTARQILVSELILALDAERPVVEERLDEVLAGNPSTAADLVGGVAD